MSDGATEMMKDELDEELIKAGWKPYIDLPPGTAVSIEMLKDAAEKQLKFDMVNKPPHYKGKIECIEAIEAAVDGLDGFEGACTANAMGYIWRWNKKGDSIENIDNAIWYLNKLKEYINGR